MSKIEIELKAAETETEAPQSPQSETASDAVAAAQAAVALANTVAADAELQAAAEIRNTQQEWEQKWISIQTEVSALTAMLETLSAQVLSLISRQTETEALAVVTAETVAAETILTPPPLTDENQTERQSESADESQGLELPPLVEVKPGKVFRL
jgi:hypothetical protein